MSERHRRSLIPESLRPRLLTIAEVEAGLAAVAVIFTCLPAYLLEHSGPGPGWHKLSQVESGDPDCAATQADVYNNLDVSISATSHLGNQRVTVEIRPHERKIAVVEYCGSFPTQAWVDVESPTDSTSTPLPGEVRPFPSLRQTIAKVRGEIMSRVVTQADASDGR